MLLKLFRKSVFLSVCHPERSEGLYHAWYFIERVPFSHDKVLGSAPIDSFCDFLNSFHSRKALPQVLLAVVGSLI